MPVGFKTEPHTVGGTIAEQLLSFGTDTIDKVAIGNGMIDKYHFKFNHYQEFLNVLDGDQGVIMIGATCWQLGNRNSFFQ